VAEIVIMLFFVSAGFFGLAGYLLGARAERKRLSRELRQSDDSIAAASDLRRIALGLDSVALEVERISEAQRFLIANSAERKSD
jgi:hypothetical protein